MSKKMYRMTENQKAVFQYLLEGQLVEPRKLCKSTGIAVAAIRSVLSNMHNNNWVERIVIGVETVQGDLYAYRITRQGRQRWIDYQQEIANASRANIIKAGSVSCALERFNRTGLLSKTAYKRGDYEHRQG